MMLPNSIPNTKSSGSSSDSNSSSAIIPLTENSFCDTAAAVRRIIPTTFLVDESAIALIDQCVREFASSVGCIASGYSVIGNCGELHSLQTPNSSSSQSSREVQPDHVLQALEHLGYTEFIRPLCAYKHIIKQNRKNTPSGSELPLKKAKTSSTSTSGPSSQHSSNQQRTQNNATTTSSLAALTSAPGGNRLSAKPLTKKAQRDQRNAAIDFDLLHAAPPLTERQIAEKHGVVSVIVKNRIHVLKEGNNELTGLNASVRPKIPSVFNPNRSGATPAVPRLGMTPTGNIVGATSAPGTLPRIMPHVSPAMSNAYGATAAHTHVNTSLVSSGRSGTSVAGQAGTQVSIGTPAVTGTSVTGAAGITIVSSTGGSYNSSNNVSGSGDVVSASMRDGDGTTDRDSTSVGVTARAPPATPSVPNVADNHTTASSSDDAGAVSSGNHLPTTRTTTESTTAKIPSPCMDRI